MKNRGLGKGLSALISEQTFTPNTDEIHKVKISKIEPGPFQPRKNFDQESIIELADSIKEHGIIQPVIVKAVDGSNKYHIIAGERRWRAAAIAGLSEIPVIIKDIADDQISAQALIENIQRQDLNPMEEADAYSALMLQYQYTQETLSKVLGKKRSHIANMTRLTSLPFSVQESIANGELSYSHAKVIASHNDVEEIAKVIVTKHLNVRQAEELTKNWKKASPSVPRSIKAIANNNNDEFAELAASLSAKLGLKVEIDNSAKGGKVVINYSNFEQLDSLLEKLSS